MELVDENGESLECSLGVSPIKNMESYRISVPLNSSTKPDSKCLSDDTKPKMIREIHTQRVYIVDGILVNSGSDLIAFGLHNKDKADTYKMFYSTQLDTFYTLQSIQDKTSMFVGRGLMASKKVFIMTKYDPIFMIAAILSEIGGGYHSLHQILELSMQGWTDQEEETMMQVDSE